MAIYVSPYTTHTILLNKTAKIKIWLGGRRSTICS